MPGILEALTDSDPRVRVQAAECVWKVSENAPLAIETIVEALNTDDVCAHLSALFVLESMGTDAAPAVPALQDLLKREGDMDMRYEIIKAIRRIGITADGTVPALVRLLADQDEPIPSAAVEALGKLAENSDEALDALIDAVQCQTRDVQLGAICALRELGPRARRGLPALKAVLDKPDQDLADFAGHAIDDIDSSVNFATSQR